jgi:hypothetical protein
MIYRHHSPVALAIWLAYLILGPALFARCALYAAGILVALLTIALARDAIAPHGWASSTRSAALCPPARGYDFAKPLPC